MTSRITSSAVLVETTAAKNYQFAKRMSRIGASAVREILKVTERPEIISFAGGLPAPELFPVEAIAEGHAKVFGESGGAALQYSTTEGWLPLREWIADRLKNRRGINTDASRILITSGSQQGIDLVAKIFLEAGDKVLVENPCYLAALQAFKAYEADFVAVDSDDNGMCVDQVEAAIQREKPKFIYVVADFQNPKGTTLSLERRQQLIDISRRYQVPIVEDNPYGALRYRGERTPVLASLDEEELVIYLSTFSKTLSPGMRIGWIAAAKEIIQTLVIAKQATDLHTNTIAQRAAARALETFDYDAHLEKLCRVYGERCLTMIEAIGRYFPTEAKWTCPEGGLFLWVELPNHLDGAELLAAALKEGVAFVPGAPFFAVDAKQNFIRLNFSNSNPERIEEGISRLGKVIKEQLG